MLTLKNVKIHQALSEETYCYTATLYLNGKKVATCSNRGCGGPDDYDWVSKQAQEETEAFVESKRPSGESIWCLEVVVGDLLDDYEEERLLKRTLKKETLFRKPGETYERGEYNTVQAPFDGRVKSYLVGKYGPDVFILNEKGVQS
jgi:hypothetical protein